MFWYNATSHNSNYDLKMYVIAITKFFCQLHCNQISAAAAKSLQSCLTLWDPRDGSPLVFPISGILEANTLESIAFPSPIHESEK